MWDGNARAIVLSTHSAAFHPRPGKEKKLSCKFCNLAVMISMRACGPHCSASPGRSLAVGGVWHSLPWLAPCSSALGLCAQAWLTQPRFPQRCLGGIEPPHWLITFISPLLLTSCLLLLPGYKKPFAAIWCFKILFIQGKPRDKTAFCLRKQKKQWLQRAQDLWIIWSPQCGGGCPPLCPAMWWLPVIKPVWWRKKPSEEQ